MASIRLKSFTTTLSAGGTATGVLTVADTSGLARHACVSVDSVSNGWRLEIVRVVDATHVVARLAGFVAGQKQSDLSALPSAATLTLEEQWVQDLYQDDVPSNIAIPVRAV